MFIVYGLWVQGIGGGGGGEFVVLFLSVVVVDVDAKCDFILYV
jgi:hypothetical protein